MKDLFNLSSYDYFLPKELIAQKAHSPADHCKLMYIKNHNIQDLKFYNILELLNEDDILFLNNSKVIKARINSQENVNFKFEKNECKKCEIFFLKDL
jgi:S-adenosylmethionine:tRNA ribosyltransferase-isomerase